MSTMKIIKESNKGTTPVSVPDGSGEHATTVHKRRSPFYIIAVIEEVKKELADKENALSAISVPELTYRLKRIAVNHMLRALKSSLSELPTRPKKVDAASVAERQKTLEKTLLFKEPAWRIQVIEKVVPALNESGIKCEVKIAPDGLEYVTFQSIAGFSSLPTAESLGLGELQYSQFMMLPPETRKLLQGMLEKNMSTREQQQSDLAASQERIGSLNEQVHGLESEIEGQKKKIEELTIKARNVQALRDNDQLELERYNREKQAAIDAQHTLNQKLKDAEVSITDLQNRIASLEDDIKANAKKHEEVLKALNDKNAEDLKEKDMAHRELDSINEKSTQELKERVAELNRQVTVLNGAKAALDAAEAEVTKARGEAATERGRVQSIVDGYEERIRLEQAAHEERLSALIKENEGKLAQQSQAHAVELGINTSASQAKITELTGMVEQLTAQNAQLLRNAEEDAQTIKLQQARLVQNLARRVEGSKNEGIKDVTGKDPEYSEDVPNING